MRTTVNPGRRLELMGRLELEPVHAGLGAGAGFFVRDIESGKTVTLGDLLAQFREDVGSLYVGPVRITIKPAYGPTP